MITYMTYTIMKLHQTMKGHIRLYVIALCIKLTYKHKQKTTYKYIHVYTIHHDSNRTCMYINF